MLKMLHTHFPHWNNSGIIPPVRPGANGSSPDRSPYDTEPETFVDYFATSPERIQILDGFFRFRSGLCQVGIVSGFQWINGSFLEHVEILENRPLGNGEINSVSLNDRSCIITIELSKLEQIVKKPVEKMTAL